MTITIPTAAQSPDWVMFETTVGRIYVTHPDVPDLVAAHATQASGQAAAAWARSRRGHLGRATRPTRAHQLDWDIESALWGGDAYDSLLSVAVAPLTEALTALDPRLWAYDAVHLLLFTTAAGDAAVEHAIGGRR